MVRAVTPPHTNDIAVAIDRDDDLGNLVLSAKPGEIIWIGDYKLIVLSVHGNKIRLAFLFPRTTPIDRDSVRKSKEAEAKLESEELSK